MASAFRTISIVCAMSSIAAAQPASETPAQPAPTAQPAARATLESVAEPQRALIRARAMHCYRMPDGSIWDGWAYVEFRKVLDHNLKAFDRVEPGHGGPGQTIVEDHAVGTVWKIKPTRETRAWGLIGPLAREDGEIPAGAFEIDQRCKSRDIPPLWSCAQAAEYSWPFAFVDESSPDEYTRQVHGQYLQITRDWGDGRVDFKGYSLDHSTIEGVANVPDAKRSIKKDHFTGAFFLWPTRIETVNKRKVQHWDLIPADQARVSPDDLADALLSGKASLIDWHFETVKDKTLWKRTVHRIDRAVERPPPGPLAKPAPPAITPEGGPDLLMLKDGRWFRGAIIRRDADAVVIRTLVGQSEMEMTFKPDEVKEIQAPEKR